MTEQNSTLESPVDGLLTADESPESSATPSFAEIVDNNRKTEEDTLARLLQAKGLTDEAPEESAAEGEPEEVSSEVSEEPEVDEQLPEDSADGDEVVTEEIDSDEPEEVETPNEVWDLEELKQGTFEVQWGDETKFMTWASIQNQLNRSRSASEKSREANERLESLEQQAVALNEREEKITQLDLTSAQERDLVILDFQYRLLQEQKANASGEQYKAIDQQLGQVEKQFHHIKANVDATKVSLYTELPADTLEFLGNKRLSSRAIEAIQYDPFLAELVESAKKYQDSQNKVAKAKPKLKAKRSMNKAQSSNVKVGKDAKVAAASKRAQQGVGTEADADLLLARIMSAKT